MNDRERALAILGGRVPDRLPWFGDLAYWAHAQEHWGHAPRGWQTTPDYYALHRRLGMGFYLQGYWAFEASSDATVTVEEREDARERVRRIHTPRGTLVERWAFLPESCSWAPVQRLVRSVADLPALIHWYEHTDYRPSPSEALRRRPLLKDLGLVLCYLPRSPFMELTAVLAGIEAIVTIWQDDVALLERALAAMAEGSDRAAEAALCVPADCFMIPENLSSEVVGRRFYRAYTQPWERRWVERLHALGKPAFIHMDGTLRGLLPLVAETGFDVIEAATPAPVGDLTLPEMRALAGPRPILWGGLPGVYFTPLVSDAEFDRHAREVIAQMVSDRRMVLGVADQVPPDARLDRVARVAELVAAHGAYGVGGVEAARG
ncbi:MAG: uroporphyrinogen decarboxylase family protein [Chloroflexota bacterium]